MKFILFEELKELTVWEWVLFGVCILLVVALIIFLVRRPKQKAQKMSTNAMVAGAMCVAIAFILSYIKLYSMPMGGSVTLCSMLPIMIYANRYGLKAGLLAGLAYGILQFIQKPEIYHWMQVIIEYPLAFTAIGLAGVTKQLQLGCVIGGLGRFLCHFVTGATFFASYMPETWNNVWLYSFCYNGAYMGIEILLCVLLSLPINAIIYKNAKALGGRMNENRQV